MLGGMQVSSARCARQAACSLVEDSALRRRVELPVNKENEAYLERSLEHLACPMALSRLSDGIVSLVRWHRLTVPAHMLVIMFRGRGVRKQPQLLSATALENIRGTLPGFTGFFYIHHLYLIIPDLKVMVYPGCDLKVFPQCLPTGATHRILTQCCPPWESWYQFCSRNLGIVLLVMWKS